MDVSFNAGLFTWQELLQTKLLYALKIATDAYKVASDHYHFDDERVKDLRVAVNHLQEAIKKGGA